MKKTGYILLQIAGFLILLGGIGDLITTFLMSSLPATHLHYLDIKSKILPPKLINLEFAFMRAIGSCLIAISIGALTIIYGPIRKGIKSALLGLVSMVTIGEGGNTMQMFIVESPFFEFPLICLILTWIGAILWWFGHMRELKQI